MLKLLAYICPIGDGDGNKPDIVTFYHSTKIGIHTHDQLCADYKVGQKQKGGYLSFYFTFLMLQHSIHMLFIKLRGSN